MHTCLFSCFKYICEIVLLCIVIQTNLFAQEAELRVAFPFRPNRLIDCAISGDGQHALTIDRTGNITYWDVETQKGIRSFSTRYGPEDILFLSEKNKALILAISDNSSDNLSYIIGIVDLITGEINYSKKLKFKEPPNLDLSHHNWLILADTDRVILIDLMRGNFGDNWDPSPMTIELEEELITAYFDPQNENNFVVHTEDSSLRSASKLTYQLIKTNEFSNIQKTGMEDWPYHGYSTIQDYTLATLENDTFHFRDLKNGYSSWILQDSIKPVFDSIANNKIRDFKFSPDGSNFVVAFGIPTTVDRTARPPKPNYYGGMYIIDCKTHSLKLAHHGVSEEVEYRMIPGISWTDDSRYLFRVTDGFKARIHDFSVDTKSGKDFDWYINPTIYYDVSPTGNQLAYISENDVDYIAGIWPLMDIYNKTIFNDVKKDFVAISRDGAFFILGEDYSEQEFQVEVNNSVQAVSLTGDNIFNGIYEIEDIHLSNDDQFQYSLLRSFDDINICRSDVLSGQVDTMYVLRNDNRIFERLDFSANERYFSIANKSSFNEADGEYHIYKIDSIQMPHFFNTQGRQIIQNSFSSTHELAASKFEDGSVAVWSTENDSLIYKTNPGNVNVQIALRNGYNHLITVNDKGLLNILDLEEGKVIDSIIIDDFSYMDPIVSADGRFIYLIEENILHDHFIIVDLVKGLTIVDEIVQRQYSRKPYMDRCHFLDDNFAITGDVHGNLQLWDLENEDIEFKTHIKILPGNDWAVYTSQGTFDGSVRGRDLMYYVVGNEVVEFDQLKDRYWVPDLLAKILHREYSPDQFDPFTTVLLYPEIELSIDSNYQNLSVTLSERSGRLGAVSLFINGVERNTDINIPVDGKRRHQINVDIGQYLDFLEGGKINTMSVEAYEASGQIHSLKESIILDLRSKGRKGSATSEDDDIDPSSLPSLYALLVGTSRYDDSRMHLDFPDKDAEVIEDAILKIGKGIFQDRMHTYRLTSVAGSSDSIANKKNILNVFKAIQNAAKANDVIWIFMSGHGVTLDDDFYYLTKDLGNRDKNNESVRASFLISSTEIKEEIRKIKANKQILILDACHSGQTARIFGGSKSLSTSQKKALESLEGKMGVYVLASSEGNQLSYESALLNQGILTYSLLMGLSGGAINDAQDSIIEIGHLLSYASEQSQILAKKIKGKTQTPVMSTREGGSSFAIGIVNDQVKFSLPDNVPKFGYPRIASLPALLDSLELESSLALLLKERGAFGPNMKYIYWENSIDDEVITIHGHYEIIEDKVSLEWYLIKAGQILNGPYQLNHPVALKSQIPEIIEKQILQIVDFSTYFLKGFYIGHLCYHW